MVVSIGIDILEVRTHKSRNFINIARIELSFGLLKS